MSIKSNYEFSHEIVIELNEKQIECIIKGTIEAWNDFYGEDADGRRGQMVVDLEVTEWEVLNLSNQKIVDEAILKKAGEIYEKEYSAKDNTIATERHNDE